MEVIIKSVVSTLDVIIILLAFTAATRSEKAKGVMDYGFVVISLIIIMNIWLMWL